MILTFQLKSFDETGQSFSKTMRLVLKRYLPLYSSIRCCSKCHLCACALWSALASRPVSSYIALSLVVSYRKLNSSPKIIGNLSALWLCSSPEEQPLAALLGLPQDDRSILTSQNVWSQVLPLLLYVIANSIVFFFTLYFRFVTTVLATVFRLVFSRYITCFYQVIILLFALYNGLVTLCTVIFMLFLSAVARATFVARFSVELSSWFM